jgi:Co/Zn/Cd efflux system component
MSEATTQEQPLTLKSLQSHLIKTIVGALAVAILGAVLTAWGSHYQTKEAIEMLTKEQQETRGIVDKHSELLSKSSESNSVSDVQIKNLEQRMTSMEKTQQDILKLLIEINTSQKVLVKNSK